MSTTPAQKLHPWRQFTPGFLSKADSGRVNPKATPLVGVAHSRNGKGKMR